MSAPRHTVPRELGYRAFIQQTPPPEQYLVTRWRLSEWWSGWEQAYAETRLNMEIAGATTAEWLALTWYCNETLQRVTRLEEEMRLKCV